MLIFGDSEPDHPLKRGGGHYFVHRVAKREFIDIATR